MAFSNFASLEDNGSVLRVSLPAVAVLVAYCVLILPIIDDQQGSPFATSSM